MVSILYSLAAGTVSTITVDATLTQEADKSVEVTKFPIEDGSNINDHAIRKPDRYRLEGVFSSTPPVPADELEAGEADRHADVSRAVLEDILEAKKAVEIAAGSRTYERMVMTELRFPQDVETGEACKFSASFEQITTVATQTVEVPKALGGKTKGGRKPAENANAAAVKKTSVAKAALKLTKGEIDLPTFLKLIGG
jgi:hypothetical protein